MTKNSRYDYSRILADRTPEEINKIYDLYISGAKFFTLNRQYGLKLSTRNFSKIFPPFKLPDRSCQHCGKPGMSYPRPLKGDTSNGRQVINCECGHSEPLKPDYHQNFQCFCKKCVEQLSRQKEETDKANRIKSSEFHSKIAPKPVLELTFIELISLQALIYSRADTEITQITPLNREEYRLLFSPTNVYSQELLKNLYLQNVLKPNISSCPQSAFSEDGRIIGNWDSISWLPNVSLDNEVVATWKQLLRWLNEYLSSSEWHHRWSDEILDAWREINIEECMQYLEFRISMTNSLQLTAPTKIREHLSILLKDFSASNLFYCCYVAVQNAAAYSAHKNCLSKRHAANTIPGHLLKVAINGTKNGTREMPSYNRSGQAPQSEISKILFDIALKLPNDAGFREPAAKFWRNNLAHLFGEKAISEAEPDQSIACKDCGAKEFSLLLDTSTNKISSICKQCGAQKNINQTTLGT